MFTALDTKSNFLGLPKENSRLETSKIVVLPAPYEATVSYGKGTRRGPEAILKASHFVEFFDEETKREIYREYGIATLKPLNFGKRKGAQALQLINENIQGLLDLGKFVAMLGGEHTISSASIAAHAKSYPDLSVLQFDAHSDLREEYEGTPYSHACVMARVAEFVDPGRIVQVGIRAQCREEAEFIRERGVHTFFAHEIRDGAHSRFLKTWDDTVVDHLTDHVYVTFDVDGLDPSIMPATGTPEPNGLCWHEAMQCLRKVGRKKKIVGFDVVELSPMPGLSHPDLTTAKLVSKILNYAL